MSIPRFRRHRTLTLAGLLALAASVSVAAISFSAELVVAELQGTVNKVTVEQGKTASFTIALSADGKLACGSTSTAAVHTNYSVGSGGAVSSGTFGDAKQFTGAGEGTNCAITWPGAPTPQTVSAQVSAAQDAPLGSHPVTLKAANNNVQLTNSSGSAAKLTDETGTTLTIEVVAPSAPANAAPSQPGKPTLASGSGTPNRGVFGLNWTASTDDGQPAGSSIGYRLEHKDANDAGYSSVSGAGNLANSAFSFAAGSEEGEGTWTYQARASDGTLSSAFSAASDPVKVDRSGPNAPTISTSKVPEYDTSGSDNDWFKGSVTLTFAANGDPALQDGSAGSGVDSDSIPGSVVKSTSGAHEVSGKVKDNAGNESAAGSRTVNVDATDPVVAIADCPSAVVGRNSSHAIKVTASDAHSGLKSDPSSTALALDTSTAGQHTKTVKAIDNVGHEKSDACTYKVNSAPGAPGAPALTSGSSSPNKGVFGLNWTAAADVDGNVDHYALEHKDANDTGYSSVSGAGNLASSAFSFAAASEEGEGTWTYQAKAVDSFGEDGPFSAASDPVKVDKSKPNAPSLSISSGQSPTPVAGKDWYKDSVSIDVSSNGDPALEDTSAGSGVDATSYGSPFSVSSNGGSTPGRTVKDKAGNESDAGKITVHVDALDPSIAISGCPTEVKLGSSQSITVTAADGESGLADNPSGAHALDTSTIGQTTKTVTAKDNVGHQKSASCTYKVIYDWNGFFQPVDNKDANGNYVLNRAKAGSAIPIKFSLDGAPVTGSNTGQGLAIMQSGSPGVSSPFTCSPSAVGDDIEQTVTAGSSSLTYDSAADQYVYVWKTSTNWATQCRQLIVRLVDGKEYRASFQFTK